MSLPWNSLRQDISEQPAVMGRDKPPTPGTTPTPKRNPLGPWRVRKVIRMIRIGAIPASPPTTYRLRFALVPKHRIWRIKTAIASYSGTITTVNLRLEAQSENASAFPITPDVHAPTTGLNFNLLPADLYLVSDDSIDFVIDSPTAGDLVYCLISGIEYDVEPEAEE